MLEQGRLVTRKGFGGSVRNIRRIDPKVEPGFDGPLEVFVLVKDGKAMPTEYETEAKAKAALKKSVNAHSAAWKEYTAKQTTWDKATPEDKVELTPGISPARAENYWAEVKVESRPCSRMYRLNRPYMVAFMSDGGMVPWVPTMVDTMADDWGQA